MAKTRRKNSLCPNCGRGLLAAENYCPDCGQENTNINVSLKTVLRDFFDDLFSLDSRFFKTLRPFLFKPGFLTIEYNSGKRILYFPPLRLYLICSFLYFVIPAPDPFSSTPLFEKGRKDTINSLQKADSGETKKNFTLDFNPGKRKKYIIINGDTLKGKYSDEKKDSIVNYFMDSVFNLDTNTVIGRITKRSTKKAIDLVDDGGMKYIQKVKENTQPMVFFLLPLFALLLRIAYI